MTGVYFFGPNQLGLQITDKKLVSCDPVKLFLVSEQKTNQYQSQLEWTPNNWT